MSKQSEIADAKMIQKLKEAAIAATPGPWEVYSIGKMMVVTGEPPAPIGYHAE